MDIITNGHIDESMKVASLAYEFRCKVGIHVIAPLLTLVSRTQSLGKPLGCWGNFLNDCLLQQLASLRLLILAALPWCLLLFSETFFPDNNFGQFEGQLICFS